MSESEGRYVDAVRPGVVRGRIETNGWGSARLRTTAVLSLATGLVALSVSPAIADDASGSGASTSTQAAILIMTCVAFVGAWVAGRRSLIAPPAAADPYHAELAGIDLLGESGPNPAEPKIVRVFEVVFLAMLFMYVALDRGFAWFHVPGTPLFVGELTLALGILAVVSTRVSLLAAIRRSSSLKALTAWMLWGLALLFAQVAVYGVDALRDSALWYYGLVCFLALFLLISDPSRFGRWADAFARALPFLLLWMPFAIALDSIFRESPPYVPDSQIPFFAHRFGNIAVFCGIAIGYVWLVDRERGRYSPTRRIVITVLATLGVLLAGFQNRGGMVSAAIGILVMLVFLRRRRGELLLVVTGVVIFLASFAIISDIRIPVSSGREISAAQMASNISSVIDPDSGGERQAGTTQWRLDLWGRVVDDVTTVRPLTGFGPGPDLGVRYNVTTSESQPLRNPHNSHLGIFARMGWVGVILWVILWTVWVFQLMQLRIFLRRHGRSVEPGLVAWLLVSTLMIMLNAIFDPTLEGPQVAFWLWFLFGIGAAMMLVYSGYAGVGNEATRGGDTSESGHVAPLDRTVDLR